MKLLLDHNLPSSESLQSVFSALDEIILGKSDTVRLAVCCLIARGHLLIEDIPGVGKTTLAHALAKVLGLDFRRIQFTSDILPADITGVSIFDTDEGEFRFNPGPVFASVVLADEVNRATPKAQSALLEAMEERQVTVDGQSYLLPDPFFVIATQNPRHQIGTFPLPESQLDRFLMRLQLGYPDHQSERRLLKGDDRREILKTITPAIDSDKLHALQQSARKIIVSDALIDYVQAMLDATRTTPWLKSGLSPRAGLGMIHAARAWALSAGREFVLPEDIQSIAAAVIGHRLIPGDDYAREPASQLVQKLIETVPIP